MSRGALVFLAILTFLMACNRESTPEGMADKKPAEALVAATQCTEIIEIMGEKWQCRESAAMDFVLVPPEVWPETEKERRVRIIEIAGRLSAVLAGRAFGVSVEFGEEKVKAEYLPENGRAFSEYTAFGLTYGDIEEFDLVEEEQRIELQEEHAESNLRHYVRIRNRSAQNLKGLEVRSCVAFGADENCVDSARIKELPPDTSHFWSLEMGTMKSPDVRAWYEVTAADGRRLMAYQPYSNDIYRAWVGMLRRSDEYFPHWDARGENPQRMLHSKWIASEKFLALDETARNSVAAKLYERVQNTLKAFYSPEELKKEMNISVSDGKERLLLNYGSEAVN